MLRRVFVVVLPLLLSGCGGAVTVSTPPAAATAVQSAISEATSLATTAPATAAPTTTAAAAPTVPPAASVTAVAVIGRLKTAGLPIDTIEAYTAATDPNSLLGRPGQYISKAMFHDTRLPTGTDVTNGGSVETFANNAELQTRATYVETIAKSSPLFSEYDYTAGDVLLRLSHTLTPDQVAAYQKALPAAAR